MRGTCSPPFMGTCFVAPTSFQECSGLAVSPSLVLLLAAGGRLSCGIRPLRDMRVAHGLSEVHLEHDHMYVYICSNRTEFTI